MTIDRTMTRRLVWVGVVLWAVNSLFGAMSFTQATTFADYNSTGWWIAEFAFYLLGITSSFGAILAAGALALRLAFGRSAPYLGPGAEARGVSAARTATTGLIWFGVCLCSPGFLLRVWSWLDATVSLPIRHPNDVLPNFALAHLGDFISGLHTAGIALAAVSLVIRLCVRPGN
jgi:hypothetical protein